MEGVIKAVHAIQAANLPFLAYQGIQVAQLHFGRMDVIFAIIPGDLDHARGNSLLSIILNKENIRLKVYCN